jgi:hypothetical protein
MATTDEPSKVFLFPQFTLNNDVAEEKRSNHSKPQTPTPWPNSCFVNEAQPRKESSPDHSQSAAQVRDYGGHEAGVGYVTGEYVAPLS